MVGIEVEEYLTKLKALKGKRDFIQANADVIRKHYGHVGHKSDEDYDKTQEQLAGYDEKCRLLDEEIKALQAENDITLKDVS